MPSVRFSRDKRGYEYVYLVHTPVKRGKSGRSRVLYWYRTPPGIRLGRKPFDEDVQRLLEQQNPDITFDWETIIGTPMPPPDMTEFWRERRRLEKVARQERKAEEAAEQNEHDAASLSGDVTAVDSERPFQEPDMKVPEHSVTPVPEDAAADTSEGEFAEDAALQDATAGSDTGAADTSPDAQSRARRRRGRRRGPSGQNTR